MTKVKMVVSGKVTRAVTVEGNCLLSVKLTRYANGLLW